MVLLISLGAYYIGFAPRSGEYSEQENRTLTPFPELSVNDLLSGNFGREMESYLLDHFPARDKVIISVNRLYSELSVATHEEYLQIAEGPVDVLDNEVNESDINDLLQSFDSPSVTTDSDATQLPESTVPALEEQESPPIVVKPDAKLSDYPEVLGTYMDVGDGLRTVEAYSRGNVAASTAVLNKLSQLLPENGKLMFTVVPQSNCGNRFVNAQSKNLFYSDWDDVVNGLGEDNVYAFDAAEILSDGIRNNEYVYFRTDMHWTPYGSYLLYREMAQRAGKNPASYTDDFIITVEEPFRGTYYRNTPGAYEDVEPDRLDLLMPDLPLEWRRITAPDQYKVIDFLDFNARANDRYTVYLGGPAGPWTYAQCDNDQKENCLLLTDSFGLGFLPFLTVNYGQVHYYDARYFNPGMAGGSVSKLIEKYNIQDIYVVIGDIHSFNSGFIINSVKEQIGK